MPGFSGVSRIRNWMTTSFRFATAEIVESFFILHDIFVESSGRKHPSHAAKNILWFRIELNPMHGDPIHAGNERCESLDARTTSVELRTRSSQETGVEMTSNNFPCSIREIGDGILRPRNDRARYPNENSSGASRWARSRPLNTRRMAYAAMAAAIKKRRHPMQQACHHGRPVSSCIIRKYIPRTTCIQRPART